MQIKSISMEFDGSTSSSAELKFDVDYWHKVSYMITRS